MDFATIAGIVAGFGLIIATIMSREGALAFLDFPSMMVVFGGSTAATLVAFPMEQIVSAFKVAAKTFRKQETKELDAVQKFVELSQMARRDGILALDRAMKEVEDPFMRSGLEMAVDGTEPDTIRDIMETDLQSLLARHAVGQSIFNSAGAYAPAFGMIGTLIGLIQMLRSLDDPSTIGPAMAIALITTFYGSILGNLVYLPMAVKLGTKSRQEVHGRTMVIEGVLAIQKGIHPKNLERKLMNYMPPHLRVSEEEGGATT
ncbi:MAG: MotA/TolQ/ExbB proton channel family protein [Candidatus Marinimicrobia bacterium]|nr:MotA/TolQ/ExbB proton channel family protein [Candidatus Neomarinimicrobiota bacterium]